MLIGSRAGGENLLATRPALPVARRCLIMGILNVTPDSFSDGGNFLDPDRATGHGLALATDGADIIDVGGESTRPGALRVPVQEELRRVLPVVRDLAAAGVTVSIDTMRARVAAAALEAGASIVNDVSGGLADPAMTRVVAESGCVYVAMHWRAHSDRMVRHATYRDVVSDVVTELAGRLDALTAAGVDPERIVLDPGLGFAKTAEHNWALLARLDRLLSLGRPVLIGASRKSFLRPLLPESRAAGPPETRDAASAAVCAIAAAAGAYCVRVHDVRSTVDAIAVAAAWRHAEQTYQP